MRFRYLAVVPIDKPVGAATICFLDCHKLLFPDPLHLHVIASAVFAGFP
jgi:hypothetical protein